MSQNRLLAKCVALLLLLVIVAVLAAPMVNLPRCANRAKRAAAALQWLLTCALLLVTAVLSRRTVDEQVLLVRTRKSDWSAAPYFPGASGAVLLC